MDALGWVDKLAEQEGSEESRGILVG